MTSEKTASPTISQTGEISYYHPFIYKVMTKKNLDKFKFIPGTFSSACTRAGVIADDAEAACRLSSLSLSLSSLSSWSALLSSLSSWLALLSFCLALAFFCFLRAFRDKFASDFSQTDF